jgi:quinohemoprotein ethanol dehydrogenase
MRAVPTRNLAFVLLCHALTAVASERSGVSDTVLTNEQDGEHWPGYGRTFSEDHYSPLDQVNVTNVGQLKLTWHSDLLAGQRVDGQPLEWDGMVYVAAGASIVQAFDAKTGQPLWRYDPKVGAAAAHKLRASWGIRGLALWDHQAYVATADGRLIALDARSGTLVWSVQTLDKDDESSITGAPRVFNGKILIGFGGADRGGVRGAVNCYDAKTGKHLWRFYTVPGDPSKGFEDDTMRMAAKTWTGEWWKYGGGGTVWNAMTYDPEFDRVYLGTGNGEPWNWKIRNPGGGDNLFLVSIVALDASTGRYVWHYQENPNEAWDYNAAMDMELATLTINGKPRKVLMHAPKNGFFYVIDRSTGKLISAQKLGKVTWAKRIDLNTGRPVENAGIRYESGPSLMWPGNYGVHNWPPMAFNQKSGTIYIPTIEMPSYYSDEGIDLKSWTPREHAWNFGVGDVTQNLDSHTFTSSLLAWDPVKKTVRWRIPTAGSWGGGTMTTAGNLVFQGQLDGTFNAYDGRTGSKLWSFKADGAVLSPPITYTVMGHQFITVTSGPPAGPVASIPANARFGWDYRGPRRVLTFALDGQGELPPASQRTRTLSPTGGSAPVDPKIAQTGELLYAINCASCHGKAAVSGGSAPDLRFSGALSSPESFAQIVRDGVLTGMGMPKFGELSLQDVAAIREFVRSCTDSSPAPTSAAPAP